VAVLDSVTDSAALAGAVVLAASHGGPITAATALRRGWAAVIAHDASVGLDAAGIASLGLLDRAAVPAATVGGPDSVIGDGESCRAHGRLTFVNRTARRVGLRPGDSAVDAVIALRAAELPPPQPFEITLPEPTRLDLEPGRDGPGVDGPDARSVWLLGSASAVDPVLHRGAIVVTGSHAELVGGRPEWALRAAARIAVFNDAGSARCSRLAVLDAREIAAVAVGVHTARIGDAASTLDTGRITAANAPARRLGAEPGQPVRDWLRRA
jgi:hypothetical protein